jgi:hypothetical protein
VQRVKQIIVYKNSLGQITRVNVDGAEFKIDSFNARDDRAFGVDVTLELHASSVDIRREEGEKEHENR